MRNILHVITGLGAGGAETFLVQLARALQDHTASQHVVALKYRGSNADILESAGIPVTDLGLTSAMKGPAAIARLAGLIARMRPDIVQGWMYHGNLAAALAHRLAPGRDRRRLFWNIRASNMDAGRYGSLVRWNARLSSWPDVVIANSEAGRDFHLDHGFRPLKFEVVPNGIDPERFRPEPGARAGVRSELGIDGKKVVAIHIARVDPMKDHVTFLEAMARVPDAKGLLVGTGTDEIDLPENVMALGLRYDIARLHQGADIIVSSSAFGEGFSNAIAEGMASGLVPVATDVGDAALIVGDTGQVVAPRDSGALGRAIAREAERPAKERRLRGLRARQRILDDFALDRAMETFAGLYGITARDDRRLTARVHGQ
ncbi:MAG TPA: glycosyltransferase [Rhizobiales bacterium]|nr:glycosyltransferase [Hyphomicrobiales bacterium]